MAALAMLELLGLVDYVQCGWGCAEKKFGGFASPL